MISSLEIRREKREEELKEMKNDGLAQIILKCCEQTPSSRPTSDQVKINLENLSKIEQVSSLPAVSHITPPSGFFQNIFFYS